MQPISFEVDRLHLALVCYLVSYSGRKLENFEGGRNFHGSTVLHGTIV